MVHAPWFWELTYQLVALCGSGMGHESPDLVSVGRGWGWRGCSEGHDVERVVSLRVEEGSDNDKRLRKSRLGEMVGLFL